MSKMTYTIVKHDGGWAYNANGTFSERFSTHDEARQAALRAAREQGIPGDSTLITLGGQRWPLAQGIRAER